MLRRTKDQVLTELPPKMFRDAELELPASSANRIAWPRKRDCAVDRDGRGGDDPARVRTGVAAEADLQFRSGHRRQCQAGTLAADVEEVAASGRKAIIFSQWVDTLEQLRQKLARYRPLEYHGSVPAASRDEVLTSFATIRAGCC